MERQDRIGGLIRFHPGISDPRFLRAGIRVIRVPLLKANG
jgi:hypothetical protein